MGNACTAVNLSGYPGGEITAGLGSPRTDSPSAATAGSPATASVGAGTAATGNSAASSSATGSPVGGSPAGGQAAQLTARKDVDTGPLVLTDVNMAKVYVAMENKLKDRREEAGRVNRMSAKGVDKFGAALGIVLELGLRPDGQGIPFNYDKLRFHGRNGIQIDSLSSKQHQDLSQQLEHDLWYLSRADAGQLYGKALALDSLSEEEVEVLKIKAPPPISAGVVKRRPSNMSANSPAPGPSSAFELQTTDKIIVASNALLRVAGVEALRTEEMHFRGRSGYVFMIPLSDLRRQFLLRQIGVEVSPQEGLRVPKDVPTQRPYEPPCRNETCIICCDGTIQSAINPDTCRHAFACDICLARLPRCAMCQKRKTRFAAFSALDPPLSQENPVFHAIMGSVTSSAS